MIIFNPNATVVSLLSVFFKIVSKCGVFPYNFNPVTRQLICRSYGFPYTFFLITILYFAFYLGMEVYFIFLSISEGRETKMIIMQSGWIFGPLCSGIPLIHQILQRNGIRDVILEFLELQEKIMGMEYI